MPVELHIPGYQYCGPGTYLEKRLASNDLGINRLDKACKEHDIAYANTKNLEKRHTADEILEEAASRIIKTSETDVGEKMAAIGVNGAMKLKRKLGMGLKKPVKKRVRKVEL